MPIVLQIVTWIFIVAFGATVCFWLLFEIWAWFLKSVSTHRSGTLKWLRGLLAGEIVTVVAGYATIGRSALNTLTRYALNKSVTIRQQLPSPIHVPATASRFDHPLISQCIQLNPGEAIEFVDANCVRWTSDPYDSIEQFVRFTSFVYPFSAPIGNMYTTTSSSSNKLTYEQIAELKQELNDELQAAKSHIETSWGRPRTDQETQKMQQGFNLMDAEVQYVVKALNASHAPLVIDCRTLQGDRQDAAIALWKRILARWYSRRNQPTSMGLLFGPYYDSVGADERGSRTTYDASNVPSSALIATFGKLEDAQKRGMFEADASQISREFGRIGDWLPNPYADKVALVWLSINDERSKDNRIGDDGPECYCDVWYRIVPANGGVADESKP